MLIFSWWVFFNIYKSLFKHQIKFKHTLVGAADNWKTPWWNWYYLILQVFEATASLSDNSQVHHQLVRETWLIIKIQREEIHSFRLVPLLNRCWINRFGSGLASKSRDLIILDYHCTTPVILIHVLLPRYSHTESTGGSFPMALTAMSAKDWKDGLNFSTRLVKHCQSRHNGPESWVLLILVNCSHLPTPHLKYALMYKNPTYFFCKSYQN